MWAITKEKEVVMEKIGGVSQLSHQLHQQALRRKEVPEDTSHLSNWAHHMQSASPDLAEVTLGSDTAGGAVYTRSGNLA